MNVGFGHTSIMTPHQTGVGQSKVSWREPESTHSPTVKSRRQTGDWGQVRIYHRAMANSGRWKWT
jgi:hypothetical protein